MGIIQSLLITCRLQGVHPYRYLVDVIQLTPRVWKDTFAANPLKSDLDPPPDTHAD